MNRERRRLSRTPTNLPLELYDRKGRVIVGEGRFTNLSQEGGLMETPTPVHARAVRVHLGAGKSAALEIAARIVWSRRKARGFAYGVRFSQAVPPPAQSLC